MKLVETPQIEAGQEEVERRRSQKNFLWKISRAVFGVEIPIR